MSNHLKTFQGILNGKGLIPSEIMRTESCTVVPMLYMAHSDAINGPLMSLAKVELKVFVHFSEEARTTVACIAEADPDLLPWKTMQKVLRYTGSWIR